MDAPTFTATSLPRRREPMHRAAPRRAKANPTAGDTGLQAHLRGQVAWVPAFAGMTSKVCGIHLAGSVGARDLSPGVLGCAKLRLPLSATGRGWAHSPSSWQRTAPGRRAEWLEIREARWQPFPVKCQQWRGAGDRPSGSRCDGARPGNGQRAPEAKVVPRDTNRRRGCRKATPGP